MYIYVKIGISYKWKLIPNTMHNHSIVYVYTNIYKEPLDSPQIGPCTHSIKNMFWLISQVSISVISLGRNDVGLGGRWCGSQGR